MRLQRAILSLMTLVLFSGCAELMANLRRDLDDSDLPNTSPTVGGAWAERGMLDGGGDEYGYGDRYSAVGHSERSPASDLYTSYGGRRPASNEEGYGEGGVSYSSSPNMAPPVKRMYKNGMRATRADFVDESPNDGSLWASDGQTNYYFTKNKIRSVGDIISLQIEPELLRDVVAEVTRTLSPNERDAELALAQRRLEMKALGIPDPSEAAANGGAQGANKDQLNTAAAAPSRGPNGEAPAVPEATWSDIDVGKSLELKSGDKIMAEIVERFPNGNYKIRTTKRVPYRNGSRLLSMVGIVRGADISEEDLVNSGKLYEYRLEVVR